MADSIRDQEPVYFQCDGKADNTFDVIPASLKGAQRIATRRLSDPANLTDLRFTVSEKVPSVEVAVLITGSTTSLLSGVRRDLSVASEPLAGVLKSIGFKDSEAQGLWRDNELHLVGCRVMVRRAKAGETITIPGVVADYVVLVRP